MCAIFNRTPYVKEREKGLGKPNALSVDARDNSASSGMITSTKTELQIPQ